MRHYNACLPLLQIPGVQFLPSHLLVLVHGQFLVGNMRIVIGDGGNKKVVMNEDERFDESVILLKKFSGR
jgi:chitin synthase